MTTTELYNKLNPAVNIYIDGDCTFDEIENFVRDLLDQIPDCVGERWLSHWLEAGYNGDEAAKIEALYAFIQGLGFNEL